MNLKKWCKLGKGRQAGLAEYLQKSPSVVSQAITGAIRIPPDWYRHIIDYTEGQVGFNDLVPVAKPLKVETT